MKQTTIDLSDETEQAIQHIVQVTGRSEAELIQEAIADYLTRKQRPLPACIGMGASGRSDLAQQDESLLWTEE